MHIIKADKLDHLDHLDYLNHPDHPDHLDRPDRPDRPDHPDHPNQHDYLDHKKIYQEDEYRICSVYFVCIHCQCLKKKDRDDIDKQ